MLSGAVKRVFTSGPAGPAGATLAAALTDVSAGMKAALTAADLPAARTALGLTIGSAVQAWSATLDALAGLTTTAFGRSLLTQADAPTALGTLGAAAAARQFATPAAGGLQGGGDLTADRSLAIVANGVTNAMLAQVPAYTLKANLLASAASPADVGLSALIDAVFGNNRGALLYRGASGWAVLALGTNGYTLQSNGTDLVFAASTPGTGALRYDTGQSLTGTQQDQVRVNVSGAVAATPSASAALAASDIERPLLATGAITLTMPNGGAGWRTGPITNANALSGLVTLAVPSGATLDGVTNGTAILRPRQKARIIQTGATAYVTDWVDRTPIVSSAAIASSVASVDLQMPAGYSAFEIIVSGVTVDTSGTALGLRVSSDGGSTFKSGASDYYVVLTASNSSGPSVAAAAGALSYIEIAANVVTSGYMPVSAKGTIYPGSGTFGPSALIDTAHINAVPASYVRQTNGRYVTAALLANAVRMIVTSGNMTGGTITLKGVP